MNPEIPTITKGTPFRVTVFLTKEIGLAAACLADHRVPRLKAEEIAVSVENERRDTQFSFPDHPEVARIFGAWKKCVKGERCTDITAKIFRAFHYWNLFVNIIQQERLNSRPATIPDGCEWTLNTKVPATALALLDGEMFLHDRLARMVYRNGRDFGYIVRSSAVTEAYANPEKYVADHPDEPLAYVVAAFYHRDHLRDLVKQLPARHVFRDGHDVTLVPEPQPATN